MGEWLRLKYGNEYYSIGFLFGDGNYLAAEQKKSQTGFTYPYLKVYKAGPVAADYISHLFRKLWYEAFFMDLTTTAHPTWRKIYRTHTYGATHEKGKNYSYYFTPRGSFDALIYIPHASASSQIDEHLSRIVR
jgi:erythromycin esterase-like protein